MKYNLDETQSYDISDLQQELTDAGIECGISGHGESTFIVHYNGDDNAAVDVVVQAHIGVMSREARRQQVLNKEENVTIKRELELIDIHSIRALREYVAAQTDAPQFIKDRDAEAVSKRGTLKPE